MHSISNAASSPSGLERYLDITLPDNPRFSLPSDLLARSTVSSVLRARTTGPSLTALADPPERRERVGHRLASTLRDTNTLIDSLPPLVHLLHQLLPLYPLLARVVQTFDAVTQLELKRHGIDRKVKLVFLEMRNIMAVLLQLRSIHVVEDDAPDGIPLRLRLYNLVVDTNRDILEGANACDAYMSCTRLAKAHSAHKWNEILLGYVCRFKQRQADFALIIALYSEPSTSAVDELRAYISQPYEYV
ncbi:hypothetical protein C8Q73DRAFT_653734 [Cubamyces lactineus]|nr:hypothetical protein C8Q73DRAFT_653734 [Cubamyces lactineus]